MRLVDRGDLVVGTRSVSAVIARSGDDKIENLSVEIPVDDWISRRKAPIVLSLPLNMTTIGLPRLYAPVAEPRQLT